VRYPEYAPQDLVSALGQVRLNKLSYAHIAAFIRAQVAARPRPYRRASLFGDAVERG
jgi:hypothetical protein